MPKPDDPILSPTDMVAAGDFEALSGWLASAHPADIGELLCDVPTELVGRLYGLVPASIKPDVLTELDEDTEEAVLSSLTNIQITNLLDEMSPDDAADILGNLPDEQSEALLGMMEKKESEDVRRLLSYEEDTAGGIMTTDVVAMRADQTVAEALEAIAYLDTGEQFLFAYIVEPDGTLIGYVNVWELLREKRRNRPLKELVQTDVVVARVDMDQEAVAQLINKYDLSAVPVVDANHRLVGRVTVDDVIDVMEEEASEDLFRLAGSDDEDLESDSPIRSSMVRLPWLVITLVGGACTSLLLKNFVSHISNVLILTAFVPILLAMGGNTGIQSSVLMVRSIALGNFQGQSVSRLLLREILTGSLMGVVCGTIIGAWAHFLISQTGGTMPGGPPALYLSFVVALALFSAMTFATVFGAVVPVALHRINIDPAVAAGPFITIANDISALLIYFGVTALLLGRYVGA